MLRLGFHVASLGEGPFIDVTAAALTLARCLGSIVVRRLGTVPAFSLGGQPFAGRDAQILQRGGRLPNLMTT